MTRFPSWKTNLSKGDIVKADLSLYKKIIQIHLFRPCLVVMRRISDKTPFIVVALMSHETPPDVSPEKSNYVNITNKDCVEPCLDAVASSVVLSELMIVHLDDIKQHKGRLKKEALEKIDKSLKFVLKLE